MDEICPHCHGRGIIRQPERKICANERCRKAFYWPDDDDGPNRRSTGVKYCSHRCYRAQHERERRRRLKGR